MLYNKSIKKSAHFRFKGLCAQFFKKNNMKLLPRIAWYILLTLGFVICLKSVREPDLWWMYRTGEWMIENGQVTYKDPFSYTMEGTNWINVKWLFEILITFFKSIGGPEMVFVLQGLVAFDILLLIGRSSKNLATKQQVTQGSSYWLALALVGLLALVALDFRFIGRPEMMSHLFTADFLFLFVLYYRKPDTNWIYALIPLQVLWANLHEGFGTGMVLIVAFLAGNWLEYYWRGNVAKPLTLTWASLAALFAVVLNPRGPEMWLHPLNIFTQLKENQYTTELFDYTTTTYWQKEAYINLIFLAAALFMILFTGLFANTKKVEPAVVVEKKGANKKTETLITTVAISPFWNYGIGYSIVVAMLFYLSLTAYRNIPFFIIAAAPLAVLSLERLLRWLFDRIKATELALSSLTVALLMLFYVGIVSNKYQKLTASRDEFGLQVLNGHNPVAAADFIEKNKLKGRCFADYLSSSYLLWRLKPDFKTYIDLRDLDIFPNAFFERYNVLLQNPQVFEEEDKKYNFDYVLLLRRNIEAIPMLYKYLQESPNYQLVFADAVSVVYLKNTATNKPLIEKLALGKDGSRDVFQPLSPSRSSSLAAVFNKIFNPLFKNRSYEEVDEALIAAHLYYTVGASDLGLAYCEKSLTKAPNYRAHEIKGLIYARLFLDPKTAADKKMEYDELAVAAFDKSLALKTDALESLFGKAVLLMENQKFGEAIPFLQQAQKIAPQNPNIQQHLSMCYQKMGSKQTK